MPPIGRVPSDESVSTKGSKIFSWPTDKKVILYFTNWGVYARNYQVKDIPVDYITGINYAFYDLKQNTAGNYIPTSGDTWADTDQRFISADKGLQPLDSWNIESSFYGNFGQLKKLLDSGKKLNIGLSIGGWTWSKNFSHAMFSDSSRADFVSTVIDLFKKYPIFNRIDIDWEYISPSTVSYGEPGNVSHPDDAKNFGIFLKMMRDALNQNGMSHYEISACTTADPKKMDALPIKEMNMYLDTVNIMTYDFADGNWGLKKSTHQTNLYKTEYTEFSIQESVDKMISLGIPPGKIIVGVAYYSRGFSNTTGINQPASGGSTDKSWETGIVDYKQLPLPGAVEFYDEKAGGAYSYDSTKKVLNTYDSVKSVEEKCKYIMERNLKGVIVWEASGDVDINSDRSLTKALYRGLSGLGTHTPSPIQVPTPLPVPKPIPVPVQVPTPLPVPKPIPVPVQLPVQLPVTGSPPQWLYPMFYKKDDKVSFEGKIYKCINSHTSLDAWSPRVAYSLWSLVSQKAPDTVATTPQKECPYLNDKIKTVTILGEIQIENIKFNIQ